MPKKKRTSGSRAVRILAKNVTRYRRRASISRQALSRSCRLHYQYIGRLERGLGNPTIKTVERIADKLGVTIEQLVANR